MYALLLFLAVLCTIFISANNYAQDEVQMQLNVNHNMRISESSARDSASRYRIASDTQFVSNLERKKLVAQRFPESLMALLTHVTQRGAKLSG